MGFEIQPIQPAREVPKELPRKETDQGKREEPKKEEDKPQTVEERLAELRKNAKPGEFFG